MPPLVPAPGAPLGPRPGLCYDDCGGSLHRREHTMLPNETRETAETLETERISGASRVGLWKILAASLLIAVIGFAVVAGFTAQ